MADEPENIVLEYLRRIDKRMEQVGEGQYDLKSEIINIRKQLNVMQADSLRQEEGLAAVQNDISRIKKRLDLVEA